MGAYQQQHVSRNGRGNNGGAEGAPSQFSAPSTGDLQEPYEDGQDARQGGDTQSFTLPLQHPQQQTTKGKTQKHNVVMIPAWDRWHVTTNVIPPGCASTTEPSGDS